MGRYRTAFIFLALLVLAELLLAQRADRAMITGIVTDPTGNSVPNATVRIRNDDTGVETTLQSNVAGAYTSPLLVLGTYTVTVESAGFKSSVRSGIQLLGGQTYRVDMGLELGTVSEKVEVSAATEMVNTEQPDVAHTVGETYYRQLPIVMGADIRLAESLLQLQPGFTPMRPNGDPMFRGSQFGSRINGGQSFATENFFDGVAFGYASGHQDSHESAAPVESVAEMRVIESTYSAQYGHTSGGTIEYTSKSGTKDLHGSFYEYFANDALNARGFFPVAVSKQRNNAFGFTVGGPVVIPKVYNGRNKTFFFVNLDWLKYRSGPLPGFGNTTPIDAFKRGDFSALLTGAQVGTDALGRPVVNGQIFNPASTRLVNGIPVRDPYPGNIIPANDPLRSQVAAKMIPLMAQPWRPGLQFNVGGNPNGDQTWVGNFRTILFRVDHQFTEKFKSTTSFYWPARPAIRNCGEVLGCTPTYDPQKNSDYLGNGFQQRIATHHATQQFDYIIRPTLLFHSTIAWDRWVMSGSPLAGGLDWPDRLWPAGNSGIVDKTAGPPNITFTGNIPYTQLGMQWIGFGFEAINRWQFVNDLTWVKGRHSIKIGYEFRLHRFNYHGWAASTGGTFNFNRLGTGGYDAAGNSLSATGDPFASFLLGQVQTSNYTIPAYTSWNGNYMAGYINDDFKATNRLTLTLGFRMDYQGPWHERYDRFSTFDPTTPNPAAGGRPGAMIFAGSGQGRIGSNTFDDIPLDAWGPRFGFAYRIGDRTVLRGGYGIYYAGIAFGEGGTPIQGFQTVPTAPNLTNGLNPAFNLDQGFPTSLITFPPIINPAVANGTSPTGYVKTGLTLPRYQNWSFTVQRQLSNSMLLDVTYAANHGTRLPMDGTFLGMGANMNNPSILALGSRVLQADINSDVARGAGILPPYPGFTGNVAQALRPYPQYQSIAWRGWPMGWSIYHSLQVKLDKRFSNGMLFRAFYTRSKLINDGAENGQNGTGGVGIQNPAASQYRTVSADDVPNTFVFTWSYELPFAKNRRHDFLYKLVSGWTLNGLLRYESGRPLAVTMANDLGGLLFNTTKRPNVVTGVSALSDGVNNGNFDPNRDSYFNKAAWTDPGPLQFGNAPPRDAHVRGFRNAVEDISIFKVTQFGERWKWRIEAQGGNITNRVVFCDPNQNWSAGSFGQVSLQCNQPRSIQLGTKLEF
jgi:hypothetical protein